MYACSCKRASYPAVWLTVLRIQGRLPAGTPGGGGVGLSLQLYTQACVRLLPPGSSKDKIHFRRPLIIEYCLTALRELLHLEPASASFEVPPSLSVAV